MNVSLSYAVNTVFLLTLLDHVHSMFMSCNAYDAEHKEGATLLFYHKSQGYEQSHTALV